MEQMVFCGNQCYIRFNIMDTAKQLDSPTLFRRKWLGMCNLSSQIIQQGFTTLRKTL